MRRIGTDFELDGTWQALTGITNADGTPEMEVNPAKVQEILGDIWFHPPHFYCMVNWWWFPGER